MDDRVVSLLRKLGLEAHAGAFEANDVDLEALGYLDDDDLKELGLSLGHRRKLLAALAGLRESAEDGDPEGRDPEPEPRRPGGEGAAERRLLTVMFIDLVDSTPLAHEVDPEELRTLTRNFQVAVTAAVVRFEGYVARFLGDGVLAYFGWPRAHEDEAERAVRAARDALAAVKAIATPAERPLRARVGIATGEVVVGSIVGEITTDEEAVVGTAPALADRLQRLAAPFEVVIGPTTRRLLGDAFELESLGRRELKGFDEAVEAWRVLGEGRAETRFEAVRGRGLVRLVGRNHELGLLEERWQRAKDGEGQVVVLFGEAGIGKSRLVQEFRRKIADQPSFSFRYQCSQHHSNSAFHPVIEQIRQAAGITEDEPAEARIGKLEALAGLASEDLGRAVPIMASLLRVPAEPAYPALEMPPQQLRQSTIACLVEQVISPASRHPVLVVVEDAHWADPSMLDYVGELINAIGDRPVLLVVTVRTEDDGGWPDRAHLTPITLGRIGRRQATEIARSIGGSQLQDSTLEAIVRRAEGVPLYVEELTRTMVETEDGATGGVELVPTTLQTSLVARLDRLGEAKAVAQIGSVIGREFDHGLLAALAGEAGVAIEGPLERLVESGLVIRRGQPPDARYAFKHALVQDAAYATLLMSRRKELHGRIVAALEARSAEGKRAHVDLVAHHALQAEDWRRAFEAYKRAGEDAIGRSALREAIGQFKQALVASKQLPDSPELTGRVIDLHFELRNALWAVGGFEEILSHLDQAERLSKALGDEVRLGWVSVYRGASLWQLGQSDHAKAAVERGREIGERADALALEMAANFYLGCAYVTSGECRTAEAYFERVVEALPGQRAKEKCGLPFAPSIISRSWLVWSYGERGEFGRAEDHAERAIALAEEVGNPFNKAHIYYDVGYLEIVRADHKEAIRALERALGLIETWSLAYLSPFTLGFLGHACVESGQVERGLELLEEANRRYARMGLGLFKSLVGMQLANAYLRAGRLEEASKRLQQALEVARSRQERGHEAYGFFVLGGIAARTPGSGSGDARQCYENALARAEDLGMAPLAAQCHRALGRLLSEGAAEEEAAKRHLSRSREMFKGLGLSEPDSPPG
ncbi:MAG: AAA family ATPase [Kiloniellales bacterium]|nr:AAA family ATPase [Kiloniellales bacterium]